MELANRANCMNAHPLQSAANWDHEAFVVVARNGKQTALKSLETEAGLSLFEFRGFSEFFDFFSFRLLGIYSGATRLGVYALRFV